MFKFWRDERAFVVTAELTLIATILGVGVLAGLASVRDQSLQELGDLAGAIGDVNESYSFSSVTRSTRVCSIPRRNPLPLIRSP